MPAFLFCCTYNVEGIRTKASSKQSSELFVAMTEALSKTYAYTNIFVLRNARTNPLISTIKRTLCPFFHLPSTSGTPKCQMGLNIEISHVVSEGLYNCQIIQSIDNLCKMCVLYSRYKLNFKNAGTIITLATGAFFAIHSLHS